MAVFSPQPPKKWFFFWIFSPKWPPQEESKCKNAPFLQWILKDDDVYFHKNYSILTLGEFFHSEKYRVFAQYATATILRHWATMSQWQSNPQFLHLEFLLVVGASSHVKYKSDVYPESKVHGAYMGPIWGRQDPDGPHVGPMDFATWVFPQCKFWFCLFIKHWQPENDIFVFHRLVFQLLLLFYCWPMIANAILFPCHLIKI